MNQECSQGKTIQISFITLVQQKQRLIDEDYTVDLRWKQLAMDILAIRINRWLNVPNAYVGI